MTGYEVRCAKCHLVLGVQYTMDEGRVLFNEHVASTDCDGDVTPKEGEERP